MESSQVLKHTKLLKLICDPSRYKILEILNKSEGDTCVNDIAEEINVTASAVSHQLSKLELMDIVTPVRKGKTTCYILNNNDNTRKLKNIINLLKS